MERGLLGPGQPAPLLLSGLNRPTLVLLTTLAASGCGRSSSTDLAARAPEAEALVRDFYAHLAAGDCTKAAPLVRDWTAEACEAVSAEVRQSGHVPDVKGATRDGRFPDILLVSLYSRDGAQRRESTLRVSPDATGELRILPPEGP